MMDGMRMLQRVAAAPTASWGPLRATHNGHRAGIGTTVVAPSRRPPRNARRCAPFVAIATEPVSPVTEFGFVAQWPFQHCSCGRRVVTHVRAMCEHVRVEGRCVRGGALLLPQSRARRGGAPCEQDVLHAGLVPLRRLRDNC